MHTATLAAFVAGTTLAVSTLNDNLFALVVVVVSATIPVIGAVYIGRRNTKQDLAEIHVLVDGRLDETLGKLGQALSAIDALQQRLSNVTGDPLPPTVAPATQPELEALIPIIHPKKRVRKPRPKKPKETP